MCTKMSCKGKLLTRKQTIQPTSGTHSGIARRKNDKDYSGRIITCSVQEWSPGSAPDSMKLSLNKERFKALRSVSSLKNRDILLKIREKAGTIGSGTEMFDGSGLVSMKAGNGRSRESCTRRRISRECLRLCKFTESADRSRKRAS